MISNYFYHASAVLEANGKVNGIGEVSQPYHSQTLGPIWVTPTEAQNAGGVG